ncbi:MAG: aminopeptidase [Clostridia bacterium]|nr:aminopeptidase [Clostridia bacterium]
MDFKELEEALVYKKKNGFDLLSAEELEEVWSFAEDYKAYLDASKTEREAVCESERIALANGFEKYQSGKKYKTGDKIYKINRDKSIMLVRFGKKDISEGVNIAAAHIDSPRLDLKPCPVYESADMAFFKTHYYGGIKKYQWTTIPLSLHGVVVKADGERVTVTVGEEDTDPIFYITDLLPHLGADQMRKTLAEAIPAESLNVLIGSQKIESEDVKDRVKLYALKLINEKYGICEADFISAELTLVPATKARDIGFDRSLIAAYGHDDRVCAYPALKALIDTVPERTSIVCLTDKEETGSDGNTGLNSNYLFDFITALATAHGACALDVFEKSACLSADVNAAFDPDYAEVYEKNNASLINCGTVLTKYTGARGKSSTSDASAEFVGKIRRIFDNNGVIWQMAELGKTDVGGGGTVAKYVANRNIDTIDLGVAVLSMHAPVEAVAKIDIYETYKAICAFFKDYE